MMDDYKERYEHLMTCLRDSIDLMKDLYHKIKDNSDNYDKSELNKVWYELRTFMNVEYLAYYIEHTTDFKKIGVCINDFSINELKKGDSNNGNTEQ